MTPLMLRHGVIYIIFSVMRTTIRLSDRLLQEVKEQALSENKSLNSFIIESLQEKLHNHRLSKSQNIKYTLTTFNGDGTLPGVDLDDSANLLDLMESGSH